MFGPSNENMHSIQCQHPMVAGARACLLNAKSSALADLDPRIQLQTTPTEIQLKAMAMQYTYTHVRSSMLVMTLINVHFLDLSTPPHDSRMARTGCELMTLQQDGVHSLALKLRT